MRGWPSLERWTLIWEIGERANLFLESKQRDLRWFRGLYE